jgi:hypothetical protein
MEPDRDGRDTPQPRASADPTSALSDGASGQANSPPTPTKTDSKGSDHGSLVTVRLSEPPSLHIHTAVPPSTLPTRKSPTASHARNDSIAETSEGEDDDDDDDDDDSESDIFEPETSAAKRRPNLLQELGQVGANSTDEDEGKRRRGSRSSSDSERVDWEELEKKEDLECKGQGSNNVRSMAISWGFVSCN